MIIKVDDVLKIEILKTVKDDDNLYTIMSITASPFAYGLCTAIDGESCNFLYINEINGAEYLASITIDKVPIDGRPSREHIEYKIGRCYKSCEIDSLKSILSQLTDSILGVVVESKRKHISQDRWIRENLSVDTVGVKYEMVNNK